MLQLSIVYRLKGFLLATSLLLTIVSAATAQGSYQLNINHLMDGQKFAFKQNTYSWESVRYNVIRLQYYLSNFTFITEDNQRIAKKDIFILANAGVDNYDLPSLSSTSKIKEIEFYFGIDSLTNHSDPAAYPVGHPLGFQDPEMNWGWSAGYRFIAYEGVFDYDKNNDPERGFEYHMVADRYFTKLTLPVNEIVDGAGKKVISINFNADKLCQSLKFSQKAILHGAGAPCDVIHNNIKTGLVFTPNLTNSTPDLFQPNILRVRQTLTHQKVEILYDFASDAADIQVIDLQGKVVAKYFGLIGVGQLSLEFSHAGNYFVVANRENKMIARDRVVVQ